MTQMTQMFGFALARTRWLAVPICVYLCNLWFIPEVVIRILRRRTVCQIKQIRGDHR
jgi:hypothetical protein